jgi:phosphoglycolate phosphatase
MIYKSFYFFYVLDNTNLLKIINLKKSMKLATILFDLDDTLVHTAPEYRYLVINRTLAEFGKSSENSAIDRLWFMSEQERTRIIEEEWGVDPEEFWPITRKYDTVELRRKHTKIYDDTKILAELGQKGIKTGIVTAAPDHIIALEVGMLKHKFGAVVRAQFTSGIEPKPSPQGIEESLKILNSKKEKAGYVGDSRTDMETAQNAGVSDILLLRGEYDFGNIDCSLKISSLYALRELI